MKKLNNKSGFTLIEIIVVLIIVGILAAIALPNLFNNVQTSQASSALETATGMETPIEACVNKNPSIKPGTNPCGFSVILSNGTTSDVATASNSFTIDMIAAAGSAGADDLSYDLEGYDKGGNAAFILSRAGTGVFSCSAVTASSYASVC